MVHEGGKAHATLGGSSQARAFEGGMIPNQNWYAPLLTSNREAGLGKWSLKDITDLLQTGVSHRSTVYGPMAEATYNSLQYLSDVDIEAMAVYAGHKVGTGWARRPRNGKARTWRALLSPSQDLYFLVAGARNSSRRRLYFPR